MGCSLSPSQGSLLLALPPHSSLHTRTFFPSPSFPRDALCPLGLFLKIPLSSRPECPSWVACRTSNPGCCSLHSVVVKGDSTGGSSGQKPPSPSLDSHSPIHCQVLSGQPWDRLNKGPQRDLRPFLELENVTLDGKKGLSRCIRLEDFEMGRVFWIVWEGPVITSILIKGRQREIFLRRSKRTCDYQNRRLE